MSERQAPLYCPYCGEEDLRPSEGELAGAGRERPSAGHGAWECHSCARVFSLKFVGLVGKALEVDR